MDELLERWRRWSRDRYIRLIRGVPLLARAQRRRYARRPFPPSALPLLEKNVPFFHDLDAAERERFLEMLKVFLWQTRFFGRAGLVISDEHRVVIGASAVRLVLGLGLARYDRLHTIEVYPESFLVGGEFGQRVSGNTTERGVVQLSWPAVRWGMWNPHDAELPATQEFAHALDLADGTVDGVPVLRAATHYGPWTQAISRALGDMRTRSGPLHAVLARLDAHTESEMFAVSTEAFFEQPERLREADTELYEALRTFYGQHPAARAAGGAPEP